MLATKEDKGSILLDVFQPYKLPLHISQDYIDPVDGHVHRFQNRCLGVSSLKSGSQVFPHVTFYEITESEISEISSTKLHATEVSSPEHEDRGSGGDSPANSNNLDEFIKGLPPKKRKRRCLIRYEIIFTIDKGSIHLSPKYTYYALPRDAVTECLTNSIPYKLLFSFFPQSGGISQQQQQQCSCHSYPNPIMEENGVTFKTKLEEFAAVCSTSCKLTLPDQSNTSKNEVGGHVNNIILSSVPHELYSAIKQMVSNYEIMCQNMMELMKLHHEKVFHYKSEIPETKAISLINQSDNDCHVSKNDEWSSSSDEHNSPGNQVSREYEEIKLPVANHKIHSINNKTTTTTHSGRGNNNSSNQIKKCLYCASKSTPMWRRGPQGAGTLCNACGVKWKHGKILNGSDAPDSDNNNTITNVPSTTTVTTTATTGARGGSNNTNNKPEKKRKRLSVSNTSGSISKRTTKKRTASLSSNTGHCDTFAVPAPPTTTTQQQLPWEGGNTSTTSSSRSDSRSPLESFNFSPNNSPSITNLVDQQDIKRDITSLLAFDTETLSVYVGEDAVEAAAVLTLLKRS